MRIFMSLFAAICAAAVLFHSGPQQAFACTCEQIPQNDARTRAALDRHRYTEERFEVAFIVATVEENRTTPGDAAALVSTQRVYHGSPAALFEVHLFGCSGGAGAFREGDDWLLHLTKFDGKWRASDCWSGPVQSGRVQRFVASLDRVSPSRPFVWTGEDDGLPLPVVVSIAVTAGMLTAAGVWRGRQRGTAREH
jgi:hypothetical protein